ncbi:MAG: PAS domain S-box protein [Ignavibacteriales bacterium]|nr:PAS domain S-box protein [Ignavibacteriales bacterium]
MTSIKKRKNTLSAATAGNPAEQISLKNNFFNISLAANSIADPNGCIVHANPAFLKMWSYHALDDVMGKRIGDFFENKDDAAAILAVLNEGETWEGTFTARKENGSTFIARGLATTIRDESGTILGYQSTVLDITRRTRAESQLNEAQRIAHIGSWELDLTNDILTWSDEIYRIFEIDPSKFGASYKAFLETIHPDDRTAVDTAYQNSLKQRTPYSIVHRLLFPDGRMKHVRERCETFYSVDGHPVRSVGTVQDITELRYAEDMLLRNNRALRTISLCNQILVRATTETELIREICRSIITEGNYRFASIGLAENLEGKKTIRLAANPGDANDLSEFKYDTWTENILIEKAINTGQPVVYRHIFTDPNLAMLKDEAFTHGYASSITLPLQNKDTIVGILSIYAIEPDAFNQDEEKLLTELADDLAYGILSLRLRHEHQRTEMSIATFSQLGQHLNSATTPKEAARIIAKAADTLFGWDAYTLDLYTCDKDCILSILNIDAIDGKRTEIVTHGECTTPSRRIRRIIENGPEIQLRPANAVFDNDSIPFGDTKRPSISLMFAPIKIGKTAIGVISVQSYSVNAYRKSDLDLLQSLADYCSGALQRIRISEEIIKSEERYRRLYENNPMMVFTIDADKTVLSVNESGASQLGYTVSELVGKSVLNVFHEDDKQQALQIVKDILKEPTKTFNWVLRKRHKNGAIMWVSEVGSILSDVNGKTTILIDCEDITARKQMEEQNRAIINAVPDLLFRIDKNGIIIDYRTPNESLLYAPPEVFLGKSIHDVLPSDVAQSASKAIEAALRKNALEMYEYTMSVGGILKFYEARVVPLSNNEALSVIRDITERKKAEQAVNSSKELLERMFSSIHVLVAYMDRNYNFIRVNNAYAAADGHEPEFYTGKNHFDLFPNKENENIFRHVVETGEPYLVMAKPFEYAEHPERGVSYWDWRVEPVRDKSGAVEGVILSLLDVTEQKKAEERLRASSQYARSLIEASLDPLVTISLDGKIADVNRATELATGVSRKELIGSDFSDYFTEPDKARKGYQLVLQQGSLKDYPLTIRHTSGITTDVLYNASVYKDIHGEIAGIFAAARDITERKQAEQERQAHLKFFESMDYVNRAIQRTNDFEEMMGSTLDAVLSIFLCDRASLIYPCDPEAPGWSVPMERTRPEYPGVMALKTEIPADAESHDVFSALLNADGPVSFGPGASLPLPPNLHRFRIQSQLAMALYPKTGSPWMFVLHQCSFPRVWTQEEQRLFQDIGRRLADALSSQLSFRNVQESEERYRRLFDENLAGTFVSTPNGMLVDCNKAYMQIFRIESLEEAKRTNVTTFYLDRTKRQQMLHTLRVEKKIQYFEFDALRKDGTPAHIVENVIGKFDAGGDLVEIQGFIFDDTKRRELERELMQAQKLESLGTIAGGVAHDFNNILGIIMAHSTMLDRWRNDPDRFNQGVAAVVKATNRGAALVKQLLTIARKTEINFQPVQINDVINEVSKLLQETFPKLITISISLQHDLPFVFADSTQLHQVVLNLCVNARDAMPNGGTLTITTTLVVRSLLNDISPQSKSSDYICIEVTDTGCGMDEKTQRRIFEPFFTTKGPGKGTGLGLSLVFSIVENHHGFVDVRSTVGVGTTFKIYLPIPEQMRDTGIEDKRPEAAIRGGTETILVIEDEEMLRSLLEIFLTNKGYTVLTADDGTQWRRRLQKN